MPFRVLQNGLFPLSQDITPLHVSKRDLWVLPSSPQIVGVLIKAGGDLDPLIAGMVGATAIILGRKWDGSRGRPAVLITRPDKLNATVPEIQSSDRPSQIDPSRIAVRRWWVDASAERSRRHSSNHSSLPGGREIIGIIGQA
jgi:hypothetical protein